jgi:hypothetical protein
MQMLSAAHRHGKCYHTAPSHGRWCRRQSLPPPYIQPILTPHAPCNAPLRAGRSWALPKPDVSSGHPASAARNASAAACGRLCWALSLMSGRIFLPRVGPGNGTAAVLHPPTHLPVFLCFACIGNPSHLPVFCVAYAGPQCVLHFFFLCSLRHRAFGPRRRPRPRPMRDARCTAASLLLPLGSGFAVGCCCTLLLLLWLSCVLFN